ncbi:MAG: hypothetical protein Q9227_006971 [Pyrenula ochraceoflavens]
MNQRRMRYFEKFLEISEFHGSNPKRSQTLTIVILSQARSILPELFINMSFSLTEEQKAILAMSRAQYCGHASKTKDQTFDKVVAGAAIFRNPTDSSTQNPSVLLLKRNADELYYPNIFEMPSGKVEDADATIYDAMTREVLEETGLKVTEVLDMLPDMTYFTEKTMAQDDGSEKTVKKSCVQLSFVAMAAAGAEFKTNPGEHSEGVWASKEMVGELDMTGEMRGLVEAALGRAGRYGLGSERK